MAERGVFEQTVGGVFLRGLHGGVSARCRQRLEGAGLGLNRRAVAGPPLGARGAGPKIAAEEVFGEASSEEAQFRLGELMIDGYRETFLGRAVLGMSRMLGPRRTLARSTQNFRSGNNYTESRVVERGPKHFELWFNEVGS